MNKNIKKMIDALLEWEEFVCNEDCANCILNQDVECPGEYESDYCTMLTYLSKALARTIQ